MLFRGSLNLRFGIEPNPEASGRARERLVIVNFESEQIFNRRTLKEADFIQVLT